MKTYRAQCEKDGRHWLVDVPELRLHTFGRDLDDAREMARDAIAGVLDLPIEDVEVELEITAAADELARLERARAERERAAAEEGQAMSAAIEALMAQGASQRDAARALGISHQRVSQLRAEARRRKPTRICDQRTSPIKAAG
ncbi:type II toxin-antitoxin system HicB family antitoxin [Nocardiopsis suaedae]|uniref:Type II toxin-antitoxin system HicB family antitoxin n=1 Tax=Nocardiopsis suaedae TaxID=3018444 RepID=A0ABT4TMW3_9ACTN|nr:type II toxin-antitoxin system HicB family antitoxin [Nocardiopsis suaedae]MDA2806025.1 type II toxin-antitoxin system HicB family antitoxin [Nocardiopsis suaedae]